MAKVFNIHDDLRSFDIAPNDYDGCKCELFTGEQMAQMMTALLRTNPEYNNVTSDATTLQIALTGTVFAMRLTAELTGRCPADMLVDLCGRYGVELPSASGDVLH